MAILDLAAMVTPGVDGLGALTKSFQHALGYIWAKFGALRLICMKIYLLALNYWPLFRYVYLVL